MKGGSPDDVLKVLMVGDQGCGKSSLCHWLEAGGAPRRPPRPTVGCDVVVLESFGGGSSFLVELREVGGHGSFAPAARSVFYTAESEAFDAVIIVYDLGALGDAPDGSSSSSSINGAGGGLAAASSSSSSSSAAAAGAGGDFWRNGGHNVASSYLPERTWIDRLESSSRGGGADEGGWTDEGQGGGEGWGAEQSSDDLEGGVMLGLEGLNTSSSSSSSSPPPPSPPPSSLLLLPS